MQRTQAVGGQNALSAGQDVEKQDWLFVRRTVEVASDPESDDIVAQHS